MANEPNQIDRMASKIAALDVSDKCPVCSTPVTPYDTSKGVVVQHCTEPHKKPLCKAMWHSDCIAPHLAAMDVVITSPHCGVCHVDLECKSRGYGLTDAYKDALVQVLKDQAEAEYTLTGRYTESSGNIKFDMPEDDVLSRYAMQTAFEMSWKLYIGQHLREDGPTGTYDADELAVLFGNVCAKSREIDEQLKQERARADYLRGYKTRKASLPPYQPALSFKDHRRMNLWHGIPEMADLAAARAIKEGMYGMSNFMPPRPDAAEFIKEFEAAYPPDPDEKKKFYAFRDDSTTDEEYAAGTKKTQLINEVIEENNVDTRDPKTLAKVQGLLDSKVIRDDDSKEVIQQKVLDAVRSVKK
jgi:hypothetical protein